jgi:hypothetical protein
VPSRRSKPSSNTPVSDRGGDLDPDVGLCSICRWARVQKTARGSRFWRCARAETDAHFLRYPRLPVVRCAGHEEPSAD